MKPPASRTPRCLSGRCQTASLTPHQPHPSLPFPQGLPNLFGQLYSSSWNGGAKNENDTDKAPVPNAFAKVRQATSAAKGIANEVRGAAGSLLEAVKHGFESQPTV